MAGPHDRGNWGPSINGLTIFFLILVNLTLFLRIYTRVWIVKKFWWDDATIIFAVLGNTIGAGLDFVEVHYGFGTREAFLSGHAVQEFRKYTYGEWIQTFFTLMWTKVSICLFLMRIPRSRRWLVPLQCATAFLLFSNVILSVMWIMQCQPIRAAWQDGVGTCMSRDAKEGLVLTQAIISVVSDFVFATLPIVFLWRVQIDFKTKVGLLVLMGLGYITGICCLVRTVLNRQALPLDETYDGIVNWVWRLFEVTIGIIAACIPTLRPLYQAIARRLKGQRTMRGEENIHFPLSGGKAEEWIEKRRDNDYGNRPQPNGALTNPNHHNNTSGPPDNNNPPIPQDRRADHMTDELVREGILKTDRRDMNAEADLTHAAGGAPVVPAKKGRGNQRAVGGTGSMDVVDGDGIPHLELRERGREDSTLSQEMERYGIGGGGGGVGGRKVEQPWGATTAGGKEEV